jgi:anti-anti-sigma factor
VTVVTVMRESYSPAEPARTRETRPRARLSASRVRSCTVIAVVGEVDAENAEEVTACITGLLGTRKQLLLDLSGLELLGVEPCSVLHQVNWQCAQRGVSWILVPSEGVSRSLDACDSTGTLATAGSVAAALHMLSRGPCRHLQLV